MTKVLVNFTISGGAVQHPVEQGKTIVFSSVPPRSSNILEMIIGYAENFIPESGTGLTEEQCNEKCAEWRALRAPSVAVPEE